MGLLSDDERGRLIRQRREALDLTQGELGERTGIGQSLISMYENGTRPSDKNLRLLAGELGIPVEALVVDGAPPKAAEG
jgi:transcriptional regulator with XRE-family HTH domain